MTEAATGRRTSVLALAAALGVTAAVLVGLLAPDPSREGPAAGTAGERDRSSPRPLLSAPPGRSPPQ
jgi:hypothetical protein